MLKERRESAEAEGEVCAGAAAGAGLLCARTVQARWGKTLTEGRKSTSPSPQGQHPPTRPTSPHAHTYPLPPWTLRVSVTLVILQLPARDSKKKKKSTCSNQAVLCSDGARWVLLPPGNQPLMSIPHLHSHEQGLSVDMKSNTRQQPSAD